MNKAQLKNIAEKSFFAMFHRKADVCDIQETFYGWVVFLATGKAKIVVKFSREVGRISKEVSCLQKLRSIVSCPVPQIYLFGREEGYDYIVLDWLEGRPADEVGLELCHVGGRLRGALREVAADPRPSEELDVGRDLTVVWVGA